MTDIERFTGLLPAATTPTRLSVFETQRNGKALTRLSARADLKIHALRLDEEVAQEKIQTVTNVVGAAFNGQALISERQRMLVDASPAAIHGLAHIGTKYTLALGQIIDDTVREVRR